MTTIDLALLSTVTGGAQAQSNEQAGPGGGGSFLAGLDQFFQVLQSPGFSQVIGGLRDIFGSFAGGQQQPQPQGDEQAA